MCDRAAEVAMLKYMEILRSATMTRIATKNKPTQPVAGSPAYRERRLSCSAPWKIGGSWCKV